MEKDRPEWYGNGRVTVEEVRKDIDFIYEGKRRNVNRALVTGALIAFSGMCGVLYEQGRIQETQEAIYSLHTLRDLRDKGIVGLGSETPETKKYTGGLQEKIRRENLDTIVGSLEKSILKLENSPEYVSGRNKVKGWASFAGVGVLIMVASFFFTSRNYRRKRKELDVLYSNTREI